MKRQIFSELGGFVIYEPALLARYLDEHGLANGDVLAYFRRPSTAARSQERASPCRIGRSQL